MCEQELDRWEERLEELFDGRPYDVYDAALTATISNFPVSIQPFRDMVRFLPVSRFLPAFAIMFDWTGHSVDDAAFALALVEANDVPHLPNATHSHSRAWLGMCLHGGQMLSWRSCEWRLCWCLAQIDGMRMDLVKPRYDTYDELYEYCYKVAGTVGLMTTPVMGVDPSYKVPLQNGLFVCDGLCGYFSAQIIFIIASSQLGLLFTRLMSRRSACGSELLAVPCVCLNFMYSCPT